MKLRMALTIALGLAAGTFSIPESDAGEGASSNYFPGAYGNLLPGVAPETGWLFQSLNLFYDGSADRSALQGRVNLGVEATAAYSLEQLFYVWDAPEIGGRFAVGGYIPFGHSDLEARLTAGPLAAGLQEDQSGLGDIGIVPASFYWNTGNFHFNLYELIVAPTGVYDVNDNVNVGRNYWSFDTVLATTWFNPETGTDFSAVGGIMFNTENPDTNYRTGTELHLDVMLNQFLNDSFAVGLRGYAYEQITDDSGSGAILGGFRGSSLGAGAGFSWIPAAAGGNVSMNVSWLRDLHTENRLEADYGIFSLAIKF